MRYLTALITAAIVVVAVSGCGDDDTPAPGDEAARACFSAPGTDPVRPATDDLAPPDRLTLLTHDSFAVSEGTLEAFTETTGIEIEVRQLGDTGQLVSEAVLTADQPLGDVLYGIDSTFLCRGLSAGLFQPVALDELESVPAELRLDPHDRVVPIDYGDVCVNYWVDAFAGEDPPASLTDLTDPAHAGRFVTENPETSSPGLAFLLATIAAFGEDGWQDYWSALRDNDVEVTSDWTSAYYGSFVAGGGDRPIVTSYATSPVAEVVFADPPVAAPPTAVLTDSCFRQVEFAGVLAGTAHPEAAATLVAFLLSPTFQADIPLNMFVYPARSDVDPPPVFLEHAPEVADPLVLEPAAIEVHRDEWTDTWAEIVLR